MTEQQLQKKIIDHLQADGAWIAKVIEGNKRGIPDIIACWRGFFVTVEVKKDAQAYGRWLSGSTKGSALQHYQMERIAEAGGTAIIAYDFEIFKEQWEQCKTRLRAVKYHPGGAWSSP